MSEPAEPERELERFAERYLDLWERQAVLLADAPVGPEVFAAWVAALGKALAGQGEGTAGDDG